MFISISQKTMEKQVFSARHFAKFLFHFGKFRRMCIMCHFINKYEVSKADYALYFVQLIMKKWSNM
jgi:hypothetical protein